jgi:hypothetical protein
VYSPSASYSFAASSKLPSGREGEGAHEKVSKRRCSGKGEGQGCEGVGLQGGNEDRSRNEDIYTRRRGMQIVAVVSKQQGVTSYLHFLEQ